MRTDLKAKPPIALEQLDQYPQMTSWFRPDLLLKLLRKVIVSELFGQYADRRLIVAALDHALPKELYERTQINLTPDADGAVWIDFVADLGDGFDSTYAIATLLAQQTLDVAGRSTRRGQLLAMGGDEVYPVASGPDYHKRLLDPYGWALPDVKADSDDGIPVYCIPGNHDWYDGLVSFLAIFARRQHLHMGGWRSEQRRSYFALQLTKTWWLWGIDTQLDDDMDQPQCDYFQAIAERMPEGSKIILCGPEPGWLYTEVSTDSLEIIDYAVGIATRVGRHHRVPILLSGDTHHYSRYYAERTDTHFVTSGGGGAFLHPTHTLKDEINIRWLNAQTALSLTTDPQGTHGPIGKPACYPSRDESRRLLNGDLWFWKQNSGFSCVLGAIYWICAMGLIARGLDSHVDAYVIVGLVLAGGMLGYFGYQQGSKRLKVWIAALAHAGAHWAAIVALAWLFAGFNTDVLRIYGPWPWFFALAFEIIPTGLLAGGFIFGLFLLITCRRFNMNHNDAFSAMRLNSYRHFLRLRITDDEVTIFPIGLDQAPKRDEWRINPDWTGQNPAEPAYRPTNPLRPHLIEAPITVRA